jgi:hypothetical protein
MGDPPPATDVIPVLVKMGVFQKPVVEVDVGQVWVELQADAADPAVARTAEQVADVVLEQVRRMSVLAPDVGQGAADDQIGELQEPRVLRVFGQDHGDPLEVDVGRAVSERLQAIRRERRLGRSTAARVVGEDDRFGAGAVQMFVTALEDDLDYVPLMVVAAT